MTEVAVRQDQPAELARQGDPPASGLVAWAMGARQAHQIAQSLARTPFVPASLRVDPRITPRMDAAEEAAERDRAWETTVGNVTAAILTGEEIGLRPMTALRSIDLIQGTPGMRAHAMRALVVSKGHDLVLAESSEQRCVYRGRRRLATLVTGEPVYGEWQESVWTIDRARKLGITGRDQWTKQPQTMLVARATGEICRLVAPDVLHGVQYVSEELDGTVSAGPPVTAADMEGRQPVTAAAIARQAGRDTAAEDVPADVTPAGPSRPSVRVHAALGPWKVRDRADKLALLSGILDRPIATTNDLTDGDAAVVLDFLRAVPEEDRDAAKGEQVTRGREIIAATQTPAGDQPAPDPEGTPTP